MKQLFLILTASAILSCNNEKGGAGTNSEKSSAASATTAASKGIFKGTFSNGMKGNTISFEVSSDGKELKDLTFEGYWRCDGSLDLTTLGPEKSFNIQDGKVEQVIVEPENGGAPFRFDLKASIDGDQAEGNLRISNVQAGCDTYVLNWTAKKQ